MSVTSIVLTLTRSRGSKLPLTERHRRMLREASDNFNHASALLAELAREGETPS